jgi:hypothetical protein
MKNEKWEQGSPTERHPFAIVASFARNSSAGKGMMKNEE